MAHSDDYLSSRQKRDSRAAERSRHPSWRSPVTESVSPAFHEAGHDSNRLFSGCCYCAGNQGSKVISVPVSVLQDQTFLFASSCIRGEVLLAIVYGRGKEYTEFTQKLS